MLIQIALAVLFYSGSSQIKTGTPLEGLASKKSLTLFEATRLIAKDMTAPNPYRELPSSLRLIIASRMEKVAWDRVDIQGFTDEAESYKPASDGTDSSCFLAALGLACAALDAKRPRKEVVLTIASLSCPDNEAVLLRGDHGTGSATFVSDNWPWQIHAGKLELRPFGIVPLAVNIMGKVSNYIEAWQVFKRGVKSNLD